MPMAITIDDMWQRSNKNTYRKSRKPPRLVEQTSSSHLMRKTARVVWTWVLER